MAWVAPAVSDPGVGERPRSRGLTSRGWQSTQFYCFYACTRVVATLIRFEFLGPDGLDELEAKLGALKR
jgi:hypothetical protein